MKKLLFGLLLIIAGFIIFSFPVLLVVADKAVYDVLHISACDTPIEYRIGTIDNRFNLSKEEVVQDIDDATILWSQAYGKMLFAYNTNAILTVNFSFDKRQELTTQIKEMQNSLDEKNSTLQSQIQSYQKAAEVFKQKLQQFNAEVDEWNKKGGAPTYVYERLILEQEQLKKEGDSLNSKARQLNLSTNQFNTDVGLLNQDVRQFNKELAKKPEEGLYNPSDNTITLFFATDKQELIHTLAHEFGHALDMDHVNDENAIMYPFTTKKTALAPDDISELQFVCRQQSVFVLWRQKASIWLNKKLLRLTEEMHKN